MTEPIYPTPTEVWSISSLERESLVTDIPEQTIIASLMEWKTPHQKCDECSIPKEESEAIAAIAETNEEDEDKVSTLCLWTYPVKRKGTK